MHPFLAWVEREGARRKSLGLMVATAIVLGCLAWASRASARSCGEPLDDVFPLPSDGSVVPANTRIWLPSEFDVPPDYRLWGPGSTEVPFEIERITIDEWVLDVLTPVSALAVGATYAAGYCEFTEEDCIVLTEFTVAAEADEDAPSVPRAALLGPYVNVAGDGAETRGVFFVVFGIEDDAIVLFDVDGSGGAGPLAPDFAEAWNDPGEAVFAGAGPCMPTSLAEEGGDVRFGSIDLAGNFSGWSEAIHVESPRTAPSGCAVGARGAGTGDGAALLAIAFACLAGRRRRAAE
jgi:hypothetical protein